MAKKMLLNLVFIFIASIPLLISNYFLFLKDPPIWPDEPILFNTATNLVSNGSMTTNIVLNLAPGLKETGAGYPPVYFYILGFWTSIFGSSIEVVRTLSLIVSFISLVAFFFIAKEIFNKYLATIGVVILSLDIQFSRFSHMGRMESTTFLFFMLSLLLLILLKNKSGVKTWMYLFIGLASALSSLSHAMGFISLSTVLVIIFLDQFPLKEKIRKAAFVILSVLILYTAWLISMRDKFGFLINALSMHWQNKFMQLPFAATLINNDISWWLLFFSQAIIGTITTILLIRFNKKEYFYILACFVVSVIIALSGKEGGYMLYFQPFLTLVILLMLLLINKSGNTSLKIYGYVAVLLFLISNINIQYLNNDNIAIANLQTRSFWESRNYDYHVFTKQIANALPKDQDINILLSSTPDPYFDLKELKQFKLHETIAPKVIISNDRYKSELDKMDYIIFTWIPHQYLADYINNNKEEFIPVGDKDSYQAVIVKLKPKDSRI